MSIGSSLGRTRTTATAKAKAKYGGLSTAPRTIKLFAASVEMTRFGVQGDVILGGRARFNASLFCFWRLICVCVGLWALLLLFR